MATIALNPHQLRTVEEARQLAERIDDLATQMDSPEFAARTPFEQRMRNVQLACMTGHLQSLQALIDAWTA